MSILIQNVYKGFDEEPVLRGVSLEVHEGETLAVIGASGAGKSVLLKTIVRLLEPDSGRIEVDGQAVGGLRRDALYALRRQVGYVFQFAALFDSMTVFDNVAMGVRRMPGVEGAEVRRRVGEALGRVELDGFETRYPAELSGGQKKRVGLARAVALRPKYLLYDEPTAGLDPVTAAVINHMIRKMDRELGVTSVVITHDMDSAFNVADRIAMLDEGRIRFEGTPAELRSVDDPVVRAFVEGRPALVREVMT